MAEQQFERVDMLVPIEGRLPWWQYLVFGLQQLMVDGTALIIPALLGLALRLPPQQIGVLVQASLLGAGLVTVAQSLWILRNRLNNRQVRARRRTMRRVMAM